jgi:hypothetical protein
VSGDPCGPPPPAPEEFPGAPIVVPPPPGETTLISRAGSPPPKLSARRDCDAVTALKRGLREYLEQIYLDVDGVRVRFQKVHESHADVEDVATFPSAAVLSVGEATYDYSSLTPVLDPVRQVVNGAEPADRKTYLVKYAEVTTTLAIEIYCSSPEERISVSMLLEDALNPVDWMCGFMLDLPHYFGQRVRFDPATTQFLDSEDTARRRWRPGTVMIAGQVSLFRARALPALIPLAQVEVT